MKPAVRRSTLIKNAIANVASGTSAALLAVVLPPILIKFLSKEIYGVWALILQVGAYTAILNLGIQTAVGRFVAHYETTGETENRDRIVSTALVGLLGAGLVAALAMSAFALEFTRLFPNVPPDLKADARISMALVGISMALGLPFSVYMGVFIGRQRHEVPGGIQVGSRLATGLVLAWIAIHHGTLLSMGKAFALVNVLTYLIQYAIYSGFAGTIRIRPTLMTRTAARELWDFCLSLSIWNVAMVMVSGLGLVIVGRVDFKLVPSYAIANSLVTFIAGLQNSVFSVLIPASAILSAEKDESRLQALLLNATRLGVLLLMVSSLPFLLEGNFMLRHYVGARLAVTTLPLLQLLVLGNIVRLAATPYAVLLIGTGQQRIILITPLVEGVANLTMSALLGSLIGAPGVAVGTLFGGVVAMICNFFYNFPRTKLIIGNRLHYLSFGLVEPLLCVCPIPIGYGLGRLSGLGSMGNLVLGLVGVMASAVLVFRKRRFRPAGIAGPA